MLNMRHAYILRQSSKKLLVSEHVNIIVNNTLDTHTQLLSVKCVDKSLVPLRVGVINGLYTSLKFKFKYCGSWIHIMYYNVMFCCPILATLCKPKQW